MDKCINSKSCNQLEVDPDLVDEENARKRSEARPEALFSLYPEQVQKEFFSLNRYKRCTYCFKAGGAGPILLCRSRSQNQNRRKLFIS